MSQLTGLKAEWYIQGYLAGKNGEPRARMPYYVQPTYDKGHKEGSKLFKRTHKNAFQRFWRWLSGN